MQKVNMTFNDLDGAVPNPGDLNIGVGVGMG